jgi:hypothetical protein
MLTHSRLTLPEVSSVFSPGFFCLLVCSCLLSSAISYTGKWKNYIMESLMNCTAHQILFRLSNRMRWAGHAARMWERRGIYRVLVGKREGKKPLGRPRRRWEDNTKMDLQEVGWVGMDWIDLSEDRDRLWGNAIMNLRVPSNTGNFLTS